jgi:hypothetical protein
MLADQDRCYAVLARPECHDHHTAYVADERQIDSDGTVAIVEGNAGDVEARSGSGCVPCRVADEDGPGLCGRREGQQRRRQDGRHGCSQSPHGRHASRTA